MFHAEQKKNMAYLKLKWVSDELNYQMKFGEVYGDCGFLAMSNLGNAVTLAMTIPISWPDHLHLLSVR